MSRKFDINKLVNAILFFSSRDTIGITKLNKLLYYSDFEHFRLYGTPIIGDEYTKLERGPVPEKAYAIFNSNFRDNEDTYLKKFIEVKPIRILNFSQKRILPKKEANLDYFSEAELEVLQRVSDEYKGKTAKFMSKKSHAETPWAKTEEYKKIDYKLILDEKDKTSVSLEYANMRQQQDEALDFILS